MDKTVALSTSGFSRAAIRKADACGIELRELRRIEPSESDREPLRIVERRVAHRFDGPATITAYRQEQSDAFRPITATFRTVDDCELRTREVDGKVVAFSLRALLEHTANLNLQALETAAWTTPKSEAERGDGTYCGPWSVQTPTPFEFAFDLDGYTHWLSAVDVQRVSFLSEREGRTLERFELLRVGSVDTMLLGEVAIGVSPGPLGRWLTTVQHKPAGSSSRTVYFVGAPFVMPGEPES